MYHLKSRRNSERLNRSIIAKLQALQASHWKDWDVYVQPLTFKHNAKGHRSTSLSPFKLVLLPRPAEPTTFCYPTALRTEATVTIYQHSLKARLPHPVSTILHHEEKKMELSQRRCKYKYGRKFCNAQLSPTV